jgi:hypothetical protein
VLKQTDYPADERVHTHIFAIMVVVQPTSLLSYTAVQGTFSHSQHPEVLWMGLGVLLGFLLVSIIFGIFEAIRGNSPVAFKEILAVRDATVVEKDAAIVERDAVIGERDATVVQRDAAIVERDRAVAGRNAAVVQRDGAITRRAAAIAERDAAITERDTVIAERHAQRDAAIAQRDAAIAERDAAIAGRDAAVDRRNELRLQLNNLDQQLRVAMRTIGDLQRDIERQGRRMNFLTQENVELRAQNADLRGQLEQIDSTPEQPSPAPSTAQILEDLENRVAELGLQVNASRSDLRNARSTVRDLETTIARKDRIIEFLNQRIADHNVDDSDDGLYDDSLTAVSTRPQTPAAATDAWLVTRGPNPNSQVRRLVTGLQQVLHLLGRCSLGHKHRAQVENLEVLIDHMGDLVGQLNDSMFEELVQLVLDVMGHLGVRQ